ncbi:cupin domain-containing protein [Bradyrhizobium sp. LHD-71]|nr:cupin domain-containing protein [Bradyrhizobium sp. LHD-71]MDQ8730641.1 cupin domain-containing protein [Bradyrhizobium sp. LHD-71]
MAAWPSFVSVEAAAQERQTITPAFQEAIPNIPGKSLIGIVVSYPPGGKSPAHSHARSAFITGYVLSGSIRSRVNDGKTQVFRAGQHWTEPPGGAHHPISENASATEPASLLAIFVVDTDDAGRLTIYEQ